ncbi:MAG: tetratricopeptide repeat protein, partial [Nevskia sp.]|nr:tetratricopeptide repeat protein [Nevskia sp.]
MDSACAARSAGLHQRRPAAPPVAVAAASSGVATRRHVHSYAYRLSAGVLASTTPDTASPSSSAASSAGGCGTPGCACATAANHKADASATPPAAPANGRSTSGGGCGSGCACAAAAAAASPEAIAAASESTRLQSELSRLQSEVARLYQLGQYEDALTSAESAHALAVRLFGTAPHPALGSTLNNLALLHRVHRQDYPRAAELYDQAREIYRQSVGEQHASYLTCLSNLGLTWRSMGRLQQARATFQRIVDQHQQQQANAGANKNGDASSSAAAASPSSASTSLPLAQSQLNLAGVLREIGGAPEVDEAIRLFQSALRIVLRKYGEEHPLVATILNNLALTYKSTGDFASALPLYHRAVGIRSRNLPPAHPDTIVALNNLAECLRAMGEGDKAKAIQQKMIDMVDASE